MEIVGDKIIGPYVLERNIEFRGMATEGMTVKCGVELILRGVVIGDLIVEAGARVEVHGMVGGTVFNEGGNVTIWGMVDRIAGSSSCTLAPGAIVRL